MTEAVFLKLAPGRSLLMPDGTQFPAGGDLVLPDLFIQRRIADGDLVPATPPAPPSGKPAKE